MIVLTLPYPISANRYWRPVNLGKHISIVPTKEAKQYREQVGWIARGAGAKAPLQGRLAVDLKLYPNRPQDWRTRQRKFGAAWDDSVQCIDLDNAQKVLLDALKGVAIEDDKWVRRITAERGMPVDGGKLVVTITPIKAAPEQEQGDLLGALT